MSCPAAAAPGPATPLPARATAHRHSNLASDQDKQEKQDTPLGRHEGREARQGRQGRERREGGEKREGGERSEGREGGAGRRRPAIGARHCQPMTSATLPRLLRRARLPDLAYDMEGRERWARWKEDGK
eukprot:2143154-Rhodomonas_salina.2